MKKWHYFVFVVVLLSLVGGPTCLTFAEEKQAALAQPAVAEEKAPAAGEEAPYDIEDFVAGKVASLDVAAKKLTVKSEEGQEVAISVNDSTEIYLGDEAVKLSDVKPNDEVEVGYTKDQNKNNVASWVDIYREEAKPAEAPAAAEAPAKKAE